MPRLGERAWFSAADVRPNEDLSTFVLQDLRLVTRAEGSTPRLNLHVDHAVVSGLAPWGRSVKLSTLPRASLIAALGVILSLLLEWIVIMSGVSSRVVSAALGAGSALVAMRVLHHVDHGPGGIATYAWVPAAGVAGALAGWTVVAVVQRLLRRRARWRWAEGGTD